MAVIRVMQPSDWEEVKTIYLQGIATGKATFQTGAPGWNDWDNGHLKKLRYVAVIEDAIAGWIALSPVSARPVYAGVCEVSVYIGEAFRRQKIGYQLLQHLITESEKENIWTLQVGIFSNNVQSIKLHEKAGFRIIGYREKIGQLKGVWHDNTIMERRSKTVGFNKEIMGLFEAENYRESVIALLSSENLPVDDLPKSLENFTIAKENDKVVGVIGLEFYGRFALLRSLAVTKDKRNTGIASRLLDNIEGIACNKDIMEIYLLTETASEYFEKKGFTKITRADVPAGVQQSSEFSHVCPQSAVVMKKIL